jgi:hypothetical protein
LFPAIVGDVGPSNVIGEASLRICQQIDARADADNRPVNDLKVTYLVFPGTAEKFDVPDFDKWGARCQKLLEEIGGYKGDLVKWIDPTKPKPPPATPEPGRPVPGSPASSPAPASPTPVAATPSPVTPAAVSPKPASTPPATPAASTAATPAPTPQKAS